MMMMTQLPSIHPSQGQSMPSPCLGSSNPPALVSSSNLGAHQLAPALVRNTSNSLSQVGSMVGGSQGGRSQGGGSQGGGSYGGSKGTTSSSANSEPESPRLNWHLPPALPPAMGSAAAQRACAAEGGGSSLVGMLEQELFGEKGQGGADGGEAATAKRQRAARDE